MFWPTEAFNVYGHDPVQVGIRSLPVGFGILAGACLALWLLSALQGRTRELMLGSSCLMTVGTRYPGLPFVEMIITADI
jgi:hypothetical protein